jgi:abequosyltransferase
MRRDSGRPRKTLDIAVGIPAYGRCPELRELIASIYAQTALPAEITICEDLSPDRPLIRSIVDEWESRFAVEGCTINYVENLENLGYDRNLRNVIANSHASAVLLVGNDDVLLPDCIEIAWQYVVQNPTLQVISRSFIRFEDDISRPVGVSRIAPRDKIFRSTNSSSKMIFRTCGFIGGLIVKREWALRVATDEYDGTLFYQIYLGSIAFCEAGIGYISRPIIGGRAGRPPLFGSASVEVSVHVPGSYTPEGRANMWQGVLRIAEDVGRQYKTELRSGLRRELEVRQSFHVFEMMIGQDHKKLSELRSQLLKLGLFSHPLPQTLYLINVLLGRRATLVYSTARRLLQQT